MLAVTRISLVCVISRGCHPYPLHLHVSLFLSQGSSWSFSALPKRSRIEWLVHYEFCFPVYSYHYTGTARPYDKAVFRIRAQATVLRHMQLILGFHSFPCLFLCPCLHFKVSGPLGISAVSVVTYQWATLWMAPLASALLTAIATSFRTAITRHLWS